MPDGPVDDAAVLDALFAGSPQGLFVLDADRKVVRYNPSARGVHGLPVDDVVGHDIRDFAPDMEPEIDHLVDEVLATGEPVRGRLMRGRSPPTRTGRSPWRCRCSRCARAPGWSAWWRT
ncbi:PAS domain-containing protein [Streptomyces thermocarboxydus]